MTNNNSGINTEIKVNGQKLETVTSFKYLGSDEDSTENSSIDKAETSLDWQEYFSQIRLMRSLVTSIFLYACESWTLTAPRSQGMDETREMRE